MIANTMSGFGLTRWHALAALLLGLATCASALGADGARVTILDGEATVLDGAKRVAAKEGLALEDRSIIETNEKTGLLRIEWPDGHVVDLGPGTRVMFEPPLVAGRRSRSSSVYLLKGWAKQRSPDKANSEGLVSALIDVQPFKGAVVAFVSDDETWLFVEAGTVPFVERGLKTPARLNLKAGSAYTRLGKEAGTVAARPSGSALQRVPRAFRDPLPLRFEAFKDREVQAPPLPAPSYAELQPWLTAETPLRSGFTRRFDELLRDSGFRRDLAAHWRDHREWYRILFPPPPEEPDSGTAKTQ